MSGRPTKITHEVLAKLEEAFLLGHTDEEACLLSGIDTATLYRYCQKQPNFARKKELLKNNPKMLARRNIFNKIKDGDLETSKWYMDRKAKEEFSTKQEIQSHTTVESSSLDKLAENIRTILES